MADKKELIYDRFDLEAAMEPVWKGDTAVNESVMFLGKSGEARLLYKADKIISVRTSDLKTELREGKDYIFYPETNTLKRIESGDAPYADESYYYAGNPDAPHIVLKTLRDGVATDTIYDETIYLHQVFVTYTHSDSWTGFVPENREGSFRRLKDKLEKGEDVTFIFYGDSITYGASATSTHGREPMTPTWPLMVTQYIAMKYGYNVKYINPDLPGTPPVPADITGRSGGTVTYINSAVGGWQVVHGIEQYDAHIKPFTEKYGCDFFLLAFGMNDGFRKADDEKGLQKQITDRLLKDNPSAGLLLLSTMVPNPDAVNGWYGLQDTYEPVMKDLAEEYRAEGFDADTACMTSMSKRILKVKRFRDYAGNNINHPNDFMAKVYAQVVFQSVIGY